MRILASDQETPDLYWSSTRHDITAEHTLAALTNIRKQTVWTTAYEQMQPLDLNLPVVVVVKTRGDFRSLARGMEVLKLSWFGITLKVGGRKASALQTVVAPSVS